MIVLAIDPGLASIGYGIVRREHSSPPSYTILEYGCIRTSPRQPKGDRMKVVYTALKKLAERFKPEILIFEKIYFAKNAKTALAVGESRGVLFLLASDLHLPVEEFTPLQVKQAVSGFGRASKDQVKKMVQLLYKLPKAPTSDDAADALAIAATYFQTKKYASERTVY